MQFDTIYKRYSAQLKGYVSKQIPPSASVDDIVQEVFYKFIVADRDSPIQAISAWLYRVAQNLIVDRSRKQREDAMPYLTKGEGDNLFEVALAELLSDENQTPETELLRSMVWEELESALAELPTEQRTVFELNELQGVPFDEIARITQTPINTLLSRKRYAVLHLRKRLLSLYEEVGLL